MKRDEYNGFLRKVKCSDEFRSRMQEKLSSPIIEIHEYADSVSGTEVITAKRRWGRFAAAAAAFVLVCGAVGGGAYQLARMNGSSKQGSSGDSIITDNIDLNAPIYDNMRANKEYFNTDMVLWEDLGGNIYTKNNVDTEKFFDYMDKFDTTAEIEKEDFDSTMRCIKLYFDCRTGEVKDHCYAFELYDNGCYILRENDKGHEVKDEERETYHEFVEGDKVFNDILEMYADEEAIEEINSVSKAEMMRALQSGFNNYNAGKAYYHPANTNEPIECIVSDRSGFKNELWEFEWERAGIPSGDADYYYLGFTINVDGYMQVYIDDKENNYKLRNDSDLEAFRAVLRKYISRLDEFLKTPVTKETILSSFDDNYMGGVTQHIVAVGQFTKREECTVVDIDGLKDELSDFEWEYCVNERDNILRDRYDYIAGFTISRDGYIAPMNDGYYVAFKLKNDSDLEAYNDVLNRHFIKNN